MKKFISKERWAAWTELLRERLDVIVETIRSIPEPDLSSVAKQGSNADATNTAILSAVGNVTQGLRPAINDIWQEVQHLYAAQIDAITGVNNN